MLTIENRLATHLVLPAGAPDGRALKLGPGQRLAVDKVTGPLRDAERSGLVVIHYPAAPEGTSPAKRGGKRRDG